MHHEVMVVSVVNAQREVVVDTARMGRLARQVVRALRIRAPGTLAITFIGARRIRSLNRRFLRHDRTTDVLSFRYDHAAGGSGLGAQGNCPEPTAQSPERLVVGEILIAPAQARAYAKRHGLPYEEELSRYVVHGLLHWMGHDDRTAAQQQTMRTMEDRLLKRCQTL